MKGRRLDVMSQGCTIYFDGACVVCNAEISHYKKVAEAAGLTERVLFVDIAAPSFEAAAHGLDSVSVNRVMHVKDAEGNLHLGVDAFLEIWRNLPRYSFLVSVARVPGVRPILGLGYVAFTKVRPYLPRRESCSTGVCGRV